ncbi:MAG: ROK family protein [Bacteroidales bacterium]|nr:ROK family protein [Bacteroidales bacterium]
MVEAMKNYVVGVDIGGQTTKIGIVDRSGAIVAQTVITSKYNADEGEKFMDSVCEAICDLAKGVGFDQIHGVGIGAPNGNYYTGSIAFAPNLPWAKNQSVPLKAYMEDKLGIPVTLTNDANAAAVGEMTYGAARGMKNFIMITLGTGVGSGIIVNGELVYGHDGFAGELGHTIAVRHNGRQCGCGRNGCLEAYASAIGVARTAREWLGSGKYEDSLLSDIEEITSKDVYEAAVKGDKLAIDVFNFTGTLLGRQFADFVAFSAPEAIVVFGGLARAGEFIFKPIKESMEANLLTIWKDKVAVIPSALKESDAAILGASALAW